MHHQSLKLEKNLILCEGDTATLIAQGGANYLWNNTFQGEDFSLVVDSTQLVIVEARTLMVVQP